MPRQRRQRERQKSNRLNRQNNDSASLIFVYFFTVTVPLRREKASFHVLWRMLASHDEISFLSLKEDIVVSKSAPGEFAVAFDKVIELGLIEIERRHANSLFMRHFRALRRRVILNS